MRGRLQRRRRRSELDVSPSRGIQHLPALALVPTINRDSGTGRRLLNAVIAVPLLKTYRAIFRQVIAGQFQRGLLPDSMPCRYCSSCSSVNPSNAVLGALRGCDQPRRLDLQAAVSLWLHPQRRTR